MCREYHHDVLPLDRPLDISSHRSRRTTPARPSTSQRIPGATHRTLIVALGALETALEVRFHPRSDFCDSLAGQLLVPSPATPRTSAAAPPPPSHRATSHTTRARSARSRRVAGSRSNLVKLFSTSFFLQHSRIRAEPSDDDVFCLLGAPVVAARARAHHACAIRAFAARPQALEEHLEGPLLLDIFFTFHFSPTSCQLIFVLSFLSC